MSARYRAEVLIEFAFALLTKSGLDEDKSRDVAEILIEGDLLGHTTHGLALLAPYLADLEKGGMTRTGEPRVLADFPAAITWDGAPSRGMCLATARISRSTAATAPPSSFAMNA